MKHIAVTIETETSRCSGIKYNNNNDKCILQHMEVSMLFTINYLPNLI